MSDSTSPSLQIYLLLFCLHLSILIFLPTPPFSCALCSSPSISLLHFLFFSFLISPVCLASPSSSHSLTLFLYPSHCISASCSTQFLLRLSSCTGLFAAFILCPFFLLPSPPISLCLPKSVFVLLPLSTFLFFV